MNGFVMGRGDDTWWSRPAPMLMPIRTMMPGAWPLPGSVMAMANFQGIVTRPGFPNAYDARLGRAHPYLLHDWAMVRARTENGYLEGLLMLNFESFSFGKSGWYEVGQAGEGLWDRQHQHKLLHQALLALHLTGADTVFRATLWGGQGSSTIGAPVFMHRASNPSPNVPRKHHKGENPHETFPVIGATFQHRGSVLEGAAFSGGEPGPNDSRIPPRAGLPKSFSLRFRQSVGELFEFQTSAQYLTEQGGDHADTWQVSTSAYGRYVGKVVVDWLLDGAIDMPVTAAAGHGDHGLKSHDPARGFLVEVAVRSASLRDVGWTRIEINDRVEPDHALSRHWFFGTLGYERVVWVDPSSVVGIGLFGEGTLVRVPTTLLDRYGDRWGMTLTGGLHGQLMWMNSKSHGGHH